LPLTYFRTKTSIRALKDLVKNDKLIDTAATDYATDKLEGMTAQQAQSWMNKNSSWLAETGTAKVNVAKYVQRLEAAERSTRLAENFLKNATARADLLAGKGFPAQRAVDLIVGGNMKLWDEIAPAIVNSPKAKEQVVGAVRQVVADMAESKTAGNLFNRNIRPALERTGIASKAEMDGIAARLESISKMSIPEPEKMSLARRMLLQGSAGWASSATSGQVSKVWEIPE